MQQKINSEFSKNKKIYREILNRLKRKTPKDLDQIAENLHHEFFRDFDCLTCANCCRTTSPVLYDKDIERLSRHLKVRPGDFVNKYLKIDEEKDYVFQGAPCPFLGEDNLCAVYESRPLACREYPHTNRKRFHQILDKTFENTKICPAAQFVVRGFSENFK